MSETPETIERGPFSAGGVEVWPDRNLLARNGSEIRLEPKVMALLCVLAGAPGRVFSREELIEAVWGVEFGGDESLSRAASLLRKGFKDAGGEGEILETVPKRGYRLVAPLSGADEKAPALQGAPALSSEAGFNNPVDRMRWVMIAGALAVALIVIVGAGRLFSPAPAPASAAPSVAVIPFTNLTAEDEGAYFALGVSDEIRATLSRIPDLRVSGRISSQNYGDGAASLAEIGEALDVGYVLDGTVRSNSGRVRIAAELLEARTGFEIWSQSYDHELTAENLFAIQGDIARSVAGALSIAFDVKQFNEVAGGGTDNLEAYDQFLRGLAAMRNTFGVDPQAAAYFRRAAELDPDYGAAWAQLALAKGIESFGAGETVEIRRLQKEGRDMALRAVEIDPNAASPRAVLASFIWAAGDWIGAAEEYERALELGQNNLTLTNYGMFLLRAGRLEEALVAFRRAAELDPLSASTRALEPFVWQMLGRSEEADALMEELGPAIFTPPMQAYSQWQITINKTEPDNLREKFEALEAITPPETAAFYRALSEKLDDEAAAAVFLGENYQRLFETYPTAAEDMAQIAGYLGDAELALDITRREAERNLTRMYYLWRPVMADMRALDGFKDLVRDIGLVDYWRAYEWPEYCRPRGADDFDCGYTRPIVR